jgi:uncharacterized protein YukE
MDCGINLMNNLGQPRELILEAWKRLNNQWQRISNQWNDAAQQKFERDYFQDYEPSIRSVLKAMDHLANEITTARKEVK